MINILFVCHGNICRSPMAEFIFKKLVKECGMESEFHIESAAVSDEELGNPIYPPAKRCLNFHAVPFDSAKTARTITQADYAKFDRIILMDRSNLRLLHGIIPSDPEGKVSMMMSYSGIERDVADPWYTGDFEKTYEDIFSACQSLLKLYKRN